MAGCGPELLAAEWPDDVALFTAIAEKAVEIRAKEISNAAREIRNEIAKMLDG